MTAVADVLVEMLKDKFELSKLETDLLKKTTRQLNRDERKQYFQHLKPREKKFGEFLKHRYNTLDDVQKKQWLDMVVQSMLDRGGTPDICDSLAKKVIGPITVYNKVKQHSEKKGINIKNIGDFGGTGIVIVLVGLITVLVLYLMAR